MNFMTMQVDSEIIYAIGLFILIFGTLNGRFMFGLFITQCHYAKLSPRVVFEDRIYATLPLLVMIKKLFSIHKYHVRLHINKKSTSFNEPCYYSPL